MFCPEREADETAAAPLTEIARMAKRKRAQRFSIAAVLGVIFWTIEDAMVLSAVIVTSVKPNRGSLAGGTRLHIQVHAVVRWSLGLGTLGFYATEEPKPEFHDIISQDETRYCDNNRPS